MEERIYEAATWVQIALCVAMGGAGLWTVATLFYP